MEDSLPRYELSIETLIAKIKAVKTEEEKCVWISGWKNIIRILIFQRSN